MFDINFYMRVYGLKQQLMKGQLKGMCKEELFERLEGFRSKQPVVYNIETTNACNMKCEMCPRTRLMTRAIEVMDMTTFTEIAYQVTPFTQDLWQEWEAFVEKNYNIKKTDMSENHFFLYIIPKVLVLHGYGDPLLDKDLPQRITLLTKRNILSYFSCNAANINNIEQTQSLFENGLDYIKFSVESVRDECHKQIRGELSDFTTSFKKIIQLLDLRDKKGYKTVIIVTMLNLNKPWQEEDFRELQKAFKDRDVYIYLKSQDQQWYRDKKYTTKSIHWTEFCQFPWASMTIKSNAEAVECVEDYNNEIILGDAKKDSLYDIWNGERYRHFRKQHLHLTTGIKCTERCDMKLIGSLT